MKVRNIKNKKYLKIRQKMINQVKIEIIKKDINKPIKMIKILL